MPAVRFLDTNVLVYAFDASSPRKQTTARALISEDLQHGQRIATLMVRNPFL